MKCPLPSLPRGDMPVTNDKQLSTEEFYALNTERRRQLDKDGRLNALVSDKSRIPAGKAFRL